MKYTIPILAVLLFAACNNDTTPQETIATPAKTDATITDIKTAGMKGAIHTVYRKMYKKFAQDSNKVWQPAGKKVTYYYETYDRNGNKVLEHNILNKDTLRTMVTTYTKENERTMVMSNPGGPMAIQIVNYDGNVATHNIYQIRDEDTSLISSFTKTYKADGRSFVTKGKNIEDGTPNGNDLNVDIRAINDTITSIQKGLGTLNVSKYTILARDEQGNITKQLFKSDARKDYDVLTMIEYTYYD